MKMIISPAKSLNFDSALPTTDFSEARFLSEAERINKLLKKKSVKAIGKLMGISENLSTPKLAAQPRLSVALYPRQCPPSGLCL